MLGDAIGAAIRDGAAIFGRASPLGPFGLKPSPVKTRGRDAFFILPRQGKIDTVAAMNKSLARNNKSQDRGQKRACR